MTLVGRRIGGEATAPPPQPMLEGIRAAIRSGADPS